MTEIIVVGACNIDQIVYTPRLPDAGETVLGTDYQIGFGGKGANQCVAASKLGANVALISKVGDDDNGKRYIQNLKRCGVDTSNVLITDASCTGVAPITVANDGSNNIVVFSGANMLLSREDIDSAAGRIMKSAKILLCQLEIDKFTTLHSLKAAKNAGVTTFLNIAPAMEDLSDEFFINSDIICLNETEASALTGIEVVDATSAVSAAKQLLSKGTSNCIITLGKDGSIAVQENGEVYIVHGDKVDAKDTTGAGDAFIGAFAYFFCKLGSSNYMEAMKRANTVAGISVKKKGTQSSYPMRTDLPEALFERIVN